ncbi:MAG TPA: hypothetical protein PLK35_01980 [Candidatus Moranbacteria bacterium]|nr:hypothetical protein [Candidatus Moranbacteria bacterium]
MFPENFFRDAEIDLGVKRMAEFLCYGMPEISDWKVMQAEIKSSTEVSLFMRRNDTPGDDANIEIQFKSDDGSPGKASVLIQLGESLVTDSDSILYNSLSWTRLKKLVSRFFV